MRILVAEDDPVSRLLLETHLKKWGHEPVSTADGTAAWEMLQREDAPALAILDWMMPGLDGVEVCRRARGRTSARPLYIILLTARADTQDTIDGLGAGADDYVTKPFAGAELRARVSVGVRVVELQGELAARIADLEGALASVDKLHGILPICSYCKKVRNDGDSWQQVEAYVSAHSAVRFNHGVCPECEKNVVQPEMEALRRAHASREKAVPAAAKLKVLIADDDRVLTSLATAGLKSRGWQVEVAHDGMQALMFAMKVPSPDVIALDIGMPGGTGFEVLKKLRQSARTAQIPVVVVSGSISEGDEARVVELGAVAYLRKPVDPQVLHETLSRAVGQGA